LQNAAEMKDRIYYNTREGQAQMLEIQNERGRINLHDIIGLLMDFKNEIEELELDKTRLEMLVSALEEQNKTLMQMNARIDQPFTSGNA